MLDDVVPFVSSRATTLLQCTRSMLSTLIWSSLLVGTRLDVWRCGAARRPRKIKSRAKASKRDVKVSSFTGNTQYYTSFYSCIHIASALLFILFIAILDVGGVLFLSQRFIVRSFPSEFRVFRLNILEVSEQRISINP